MKLKATNQMAARVKATRREARELMAQRGKENGSRFGYGEKYYLVPKNSSFEVFEYFEQRGDQESH